MSIVSGRATIDGSVVGGDPDELLTAVISQKKDYKPSAADTAAMSTVVPQITKCMPSLGSVNP